MRIFLAQGCARTPFFSAVPILHISMHVMMKKTVKNEIDNVSESSSFRMPQMQGRGFCGKTSGNE